MREIHDDFGQTNFRVWNKRETQTNRREPRGHGDESSRVLWVFYKTMNHCCLQHGSTESKAHPCGSFSPEDDLLHGVDTNNASGFNVCKGPLYPRRVALGLLSGMTSRHAVLGPEIRGVSPCCQASVLVKPPTARHWVTTHDLHGSCCVAELPKFPAKGRLTAKYQ